MTGIDWPGWFTESFLSYRWVWVTAVILIFGISLLQHHPAFSEQNSTPTRGETANHYNHQSNPSYKNQRCIFCNDYNSTQFRFLLPIRACQWRSTQLLASSFYTLFEFSSTQIQWTTWFNSAKILCGFRIQLLANLSFKLTVKTNQLDSEHGDPWWK